MKIINFLLFLFLVTGAYAQQPEVKILWNERPLSWRDFKAAPAPESEYHASTNSGLSYSWSARFKGEEIQLAYTVAAYFYPESSWVSEKNEGLLAHEQLHFDISELHARLLRKKLEEFQPKGEKDLKAALRDLYEGIEAERKQMQEQYDLETRHSENSEAQALWEKKVALALQELEKYRAKD